MEPFWYIIPASKIHYHISNFNIFFTFIFIVYLNCCIAEHGPVCSWGLDARATQGQGAVRSMEVWTESKYKPGQEARRSVWELSLGMSWVGELKNQAECRVSGKPGWRVKLWADAIQMLSPEGRGDNLYSQALPLAEGTPVHRIKSAI